MRLENSIQIECDRDKLFQITQDYKIRLDWDPFLKEARLLDGAVSASVGVRALCVAKDGLAMETEYVSYRPPEVVAVKMTRGPFFFRSFSGTWRFEGRTKLTYIYSFRLTRMLFFLEPVVGRVLEKQWVKRLESLKKYAEGSK